MTWSRTQARPAHDVFLPHDYPAVYHRRFYTEQYLSHSLLANSQKFEVVFATYLMSMRHRQALPATFGPEVGDSLFCGGSFWIRSLE